MRYSDRLCYWIRRNRWRHDDAILLGINLTTRSYRAGAQVLGDTCGVYHSMSDHPSADPVSDKDTVVHIPQTASHHCNRRHLADDPFIRGLCRRGNHFGTSRNSYYPIFLIAEKKPWFDRLFVQNSKGEIKRSMLLLSGTGTLIGASTELFSLSEYDTAAVPAAIKAVLLLSSIL